ncbi:MAG: ABC transporter ATP-binding protein [Betaproteobacteria bacterium]|nr:ABC transporter ATP-binding protein [Betaproteobacteria bacterium]
MSGTLELRQVSQRYGKRLVLDDISLTLNDGGIACLLGASGCGKTTLLRCIAGFEDIVAGDILLNGQIVTRPGYVMPPESRRIGMVFQDYALFPHLSVARNVAFGLHGAGDAARNARVDELLAIVGLEGVAQRYPHELSGGQQQRVALARALAPRPALMLLDEPFSNLDVEMRERLSIEVRDILKSQHTTTILVTHDQNEAFTFADEIGIMMAGRIAQWATPYLLYHEPATREIAEFIGHGVFLPGVMLEGNRVRMELGELLGDTPIAAAPGATVDVLLRPDDILHDDTSAMRATVITKAFRGAQFIYTLELPGGGRVLSFVPSHHNHAIGEKIGIRLEIDHLVAFTRG